MLTIISVVIVYFTFLFKDVLRERLKELSESLESAENLFRSELGFGGLSSMVQTISMQVLSLRQLQLKSEAEKRKREADYSETIPLERAAVANIRSHLVASFDAVCRLLEKLPRIAGDLREKGDQLKVELSVLNEEVNLGLKGPVPTDWTGVSQLKLLSAKVTIKEVDVALFGDAVLTRARQAKEVSEKVYRLCNWASYILYTLGLVLAWYANRHGISSLANRD